ncbi:MAG: DUF58 domain-containing protein [Myxococcota bacterium]
MKLLDRATQRLLDRLRLVVRARSTASRQGSHRSPVLASGLEFADHRHYVPGDDVRHIDWKAFARHRQLSIRQFEEERDARIYLLCDVSASMTRGEPPKTDVAKRLTAAFAYLGMKQFDAVQVLSFSSTLQSSGRSFRSTNRVVELERYLIDRETKGETSFEDAVRAFATQHRGRGSVIVISDLMATEGWEEGFRVLAGLGHQLTVLRVTCAEDDTPDFKGELELFDAERDQRVRIRVGRELLEAYQQIVQEHTDELRSLVQRLGGRLTEAPVELSTDDLVRKVIGRPELDARLGTGATP